VKSFCVIESNDWPGAAGAVDHQHVAGKHAIASEQAYRIGRMARGEEHAHLEVADAEDVSVVNVNLNVRRRRETMHRDRRSCEL
jgi:hypothetical protein